MLTTAAYSSLMRQCPDLTAVRAELRKFSVGELFAALPTCNCSDDRLEHGLVLSLWHVLMIAMQAVDMPYSYRRQMWYWATVTSIHRSIHAVCWCPLPPGSHPHRHGTAPAVRLRRRTIRAQRLLRFPSWYSLRYARNGRTSVFRPM